MDTVLNALNKNMEDKHSMQYQHVVGRMVFVILVGVVLQEDFVKNMEFGKILFGICARNSFAAR